MAGLDELAAYLVLGNSQRQAIAAEDPYAGGQQMGNTLLQTIMQDTVQRPSGSSKERIALAALAGLGGGLFGGLSNNYRARAEDAYQDTIGKMLLGMPVEKPSVLPSSLFGDARQLSNLFKIQNTLAEQQAQRQLGVELAKEDRQAANALKNTIAGKIAENPYQADRILTALGGALGRAAPQAQPIGVKVASTQGVDVDGAVLPAGLDGASTRPTILSERDMAPMGAASPEQLQYEQAMMKYGGNKELAQAEIKRAMEAPDRQRQEINALRDKFNALKPVTEFASVLTAANALSGALKDPSKVADQELVRYSIQMIEPGMAVREGEAAAVANSQSIPEAWKGRLVGALSGQSSLGDDVREGIKRLGMRAYDAKRSVYEQALPYYQDLAVSSGMDPSESISYLGPAPEAASIFGASQPASGMPGGAAAPPGLDMAAMQQAAAALKAQGKSTQEVAAELRRMHAISQMPRSSTGVPLG